MNAGKTTYICSQQTTVPKATISDKNQNFIYQYSINMAKGDKMKKLFANIISWAAIVLGLLVIVLVLYKVIKGL